MTKVFTPGVYPDNVTDCHAMLRLVEAMLGHEQARLAAVELLSQPTFKAADEITRLNADNARLVADLNLRAQHVTRLNALVDEMREGLEMAVPHLSGPPYAHRDDIGAVRIKLRCLITKASRE